MKLEVNGTTVELPPEATVEMLLAALDKADTPCAVERNGTLVPWKTRGGTALADGDRIEIVTLVGGG
ncbi:MAG: sulfur carrier protein ThiS [Phycisphaerales bacterium]|jgi:thiamine biosynthesis protein ThiS|nr:sulfur carrier protein ThiS [Phycisphaerales bacterium]